MKERVQAAMSAVRSRQRPRAGDDRRYRQSAGGILNIALNRVRQRRKARLEMLSRLEGQR